MDNFNIRGYKYYCRKMHLKYTDYKSLQEFRLVCEMLDKFDKGKKYEKIR